MRIYIAVISLVAATALAAVALKANTSQESTQQRDAAGQELSKDSAPAAQTAPAELAEADFKSAAPQTNVPELKQTTATTQTPAGGSVAQSATKEPSSESGAKKMDVEQLLGRTRAALGGEAELGEVKALTASAQMRRRTRNQDQSGSVNLDLLMPDKFKKTETLSLIAGIEVTMVKALNGEQVWTDSRSSASSAQVMISRPETANASATQLQDMRSEFSRYVLALLLTPPPALAAQFTYAGEAEAPDGRADVLDIKGADGFAARLFLDKKTHRPLMMSYRGVAPRTSMSSTSASGVSRDDLDKIIKDAQSKAAARQEAEITLSFADYRAVNGVYLPRVITKSVGGQAIEEWQSIQYKINPTDLKPQKFVK